MKMIESMSKRREPLGCKLSWPDWTVNELVDVWVECRKPTAFWMEGIRLRSFSPSLLPPCIYLFTPEGPWENQGSRESVTSCVPNFHSTLRCLQNSPAWGSSTGHCESRLGLCLSQTSKQMRRVHVSYLRVPAPRPKKLTPLRRISCTSPTLCTGR